MRSGGPKDPATVKPDPAKGEKTPEQQAKEVSPEVSAWITRSAGIKNQDGTGFKFTLLSNPLSAFKLLLGQDIDLFKFHLPVLDIARCSR